MIKLLIRPDQFAGLKIDETPLTEEERATNIMSVRKSSTAKRLESQKSGSGSFIDQQNKATQSLQNLIRQRSALLRQESQGKDVKPAEIDESTPAMNKLVARLQMAKVASEQESEEIKPARINESSKLIEGIEPEN